MAKIIKKEEITPSTIKELAKEIKNGSLVIFPTETVYGIGCNAYDRSACQRIYEAKGRPKEKPLIVLISNLKMLEHLVEKISPLEQKLIDTFWPGALTIKFKKKQEVIPEIISAGDEYVRVRLQGVGITHDLIEVSNVPLVAPSANLSGSKTGTKIKNILKELGEKVDYILDYGDIESDIPSTIVEVKDESIVILREGKISKEELKKVATLKKENTD